MSTTELTRAEKKDIATISGDARKGFISAIERWGGALAKQGISEGERALTIGEAMVGLRAALTDEIMEKAVMPLMNSPLGFDTDRNPNKGYSGNLYDVETVRDCAITAIATGFHMTGGMWTIISGRCYGRKEGFEYLASRACSSSFSCDVPPIPQGLSMNGGYVNVAVKVRYTRHGSEKVESFEQVYPCLLNKNNHVPVDFLAGKAKRKAYRDLVGILSGQFLNDFEEPETAGSVHGIVHKRASKKEEKAGFDRAIEEMAKENQVFSDFIDLIGEAKDDKALNSLAAEVAKSSLSEEKKNKLKGYFQERDEELKGGKK